ncbi:LysM peptidoglycan-binding domain-containing protein [bacterium]|nr:LysM peptidoglycan-binding domain-containing protein [bacterium]
MKKILYIIILSMLLNACSSFIPLIETSNVFLDGETASTNDYSSSDDSEEDFSGTETDNKRAEEMYNYQTTIDSLYKELIDRDALIDSLIFEISKYKDNIMIVDVGFPNEIEFAGQIIDLSIERNLERFEKAYNSEVKSAVSFIPRSGRYFALMDSIFTEAGVPIDTKYLAIAESRLSYRAHSHMGADGIWQIMPNTGKHYKMQINDFIDERRDIYKSTQVAAQLLNDTYRYFSQKGAEDWLLAYCAYNAGMGNVNKVLQAQGGTKFTDLIFKTQETNEYVWKAIAIKYIFENEEKIFGSKFEREPNLLERTKVIQVTLNGHYKLDEWAKAQGTNIGSVYELNPWIKIYRQSRQKYSAINDVVLPAGIHNILVPLEAIPDTIKVAELEKLFLNKNAGFFTHHVVKKGDNLYDIARKYKTTVAKIKKLNGMNSNMIRPGQKLKLYGNTSDSESGVYTVQKGDSISGISTKLRVKQNYLITKNNLKKDKNGLVLIYPGQKLEY